MDAIVPFTVGGGAMRGRLVRLSAAAHDAIARQEVPDAVGRLLGEAMALAAALGGSLKFKGVMTLQTESDGPVSRLVADATSDGDLRANAAFDARRLAALAGPGFADLVGRGQLAFTVDQGVHTERYQGIVPLAGESLAASAAEYFRRSEQIETELTLAASPPAEGYGWRAGALLLQRLPLAGASEADDDAWETASVFHRSLTAAELLDPALADEALLTRLFATLEARMFPASPLRFGCRCSEMRLEGILRGMEPEDLIAAATGGRIEVTCEFCKTSYVFPLSRLLPTRH